MKQDSRGGSGENVCHQCGLCCTLFYINLNEPEYSSGRYRTIFDELAPDTFATAALSGANFLAKQDDGSCIYLAGGSCSIHEERPEVCKGFFCDSNAPEYSEMRQMVEEARAE